MVINSISTVKKIEILTFSSLYIFRSPNNLKHLVEKNNYFVDPYNPILMFCDLIDNILNNNRQCVRKIRQKYKCITWRRLSHIERFQVEIDKVSQGHAM